MKNVIPILISVFISINVFAQSKSAISGTVTAENGKSIASATVELLKAADSSLVKVGVSADNGKYSFDNINNGQYLIAVSAVGHVKSWSGRFDVLAGSDTKVDPIVLTAQSKDLKAVTIAARKPLMELKI